MNIDADMAMPEYVVSLDEINLTPNEDLLDRSPALIDQPDQKEPDTYADRCDMTGSIG